MLVPSLGAPLSPIGPGIRRHLVTDRLYHEIMGQTLAHRPDQAAAAAAGSGRRLHVPRRHSARPRRRRPARTLCLERVSGGGVLPRHRDPRGGRGAGPSLWQARQRQRRSAPPPPRALRGEPRARRTAVPGHPMVVAGSACSVHGAAPATGAHARAPQARVQELARHARERPLRDAAQRRLRQSDGQSRVRRVPGPLRHDDSSRYPCGIGIPHRDGRLTGVVLR